MESLTFWKLNMKFEFKRQCRVPDATEHRTKGTALCCAVAQDTSRGQNKKLWSSVAYDCYVVGLLIIENFFGYLSEMVRNFPLLLTSILHL